MVKKTKGEIMKMTKKCTANGIVTGILTLFLLCLLSSTSFSEPPKVKMETFGFDAVAEYKKHTKEKKKEPNSGELVNAQYLFDRNYYENRALMRAEPGPIIRVMFIKTF